MGRTKAEPLKRVYDATIIPGVQIERAMQILANNSTMSLLLASGLLLRAKSKPLHMLTCFKAAANHGS